MKNRFQVYGQWMTRKEQIKYSIQETRFHLRIYVSWTFGPCWNEQEVNIDSFIFVGRIPDLVHLPVTHVWNYYKQSHLLETWKVNLACHAFQMSSCTFWRKRWSSTGRLRFLNPWMWFCRSCIHWFLVFSSFYLLAICSIGGCKSTFPAFKRIDIYCRSPLPRNCFINLRLVLIIYNL